MRFTIVVTYIAVILITLVIMTVYTLGLLGDNLYDNEYVDMFTKANIISESVSQVWDNNFDVTSDRFNDPVERCLAGTNIRGVITNASYTIMYDTNRDANLLGKVFMRDILKDALEGGQVSSAETNESGTKAISVSVPIEVNNEVVGSVYLVQNITSIDNTIAAARTSMVVFGIMTIILIGLLSFGMSYIITSPLEQFTKVAGEISKGNFSMRMKVSGHNEITQMSETFNYMCDELENLEEKRRKFVSDASHELKTPMAGIKLVCDSITNADNIDIDTVKEFLGDLSEEVERLTRVVERLLALTKLNSGGDSLRGAQTDIRALVNAVVRKITPLAAKKDVMVYSDFDEAADKPIVIDYDKIFEAVYNVADNAVKYTPDGGFVHISLLMQDDFAVIRIEDNGPGIPESEQDKIFERFYRLDDSRARDTGGTGLGLAIARESVLMHNGEIRVQSSDTGGSVFTIRLPYTVSKGDTV